MNRKMLLGDPPPIRITHQDLLLIEELLAAMTSSSQVATFLQDELDRASIADDDGAAFVSLGTKLTFVDEQGSRRTGTLVLPGRQSDVPDAISILTPVGSALLGLSEGQSIAYATPDGRTKVLTILHIHPT
jgi:regulator of nucleoside diphosphate kinase